MIHKIVEGIRSLREEHEGKKPSGAKRSPDWPRVRAKHLQRHPTCKVCGSDEKLEVHHIKSFHEHPELELNNYNLITLCESKKYGVDCHRFIGHLGSYKKINKNCKADAETWARKLKEVHNGK